MDEAAGAKTLDGHTGQAGDDGAKSALLAFLEHVEREHRDDNFLSVKHGNYTVTTDEAPAEIIDWALQYLQYM